MTTPNRIQGAVGQQDLRKRLPDQSDVQAYYNKSFSGDARASMQRVLSNYAQLIKNIRNILPGALEKALTPTFEKALRYCPVDTGKLVASGKLISGRGGYYKPYARISFGDEGLIHYAAIVHERTDLHHDAPTRAKYLQSAMEEDLGEFKGRIVAAMEIS